MDGTRRSYEFVKKVNNELESRLRDMGIHEGNLMDHDVRRNLMPDGTWVFTLDNKPVLTVHPNEYMIE